MRRNGGQPDSLRRYPQLSNDFRIDPDAGLSDVRAI
jgi:hypothetical protein